MFGIIVLILISSLIKITNGHIPPFWINSTQSAIENGINVENVKSRFCRNGLSQHPFVYLDYTMVDEIYGQEKVEEILKKYSHIAINLEAICKESIGQRLGTMYEGQIEAPPTEESLVFQEKTIEVPTRPFEASQTTAQVSATTEDPLIGLPVKLESQERPVEVAEEAEEEKDKKKKDKDKDDDDSGPIGIDLSSLKKESIIKIESTKEYDKELDNMLRRFERMARTGEKPFASTFILPILKKVKYDPRSAPIIVEDQIVNVKIGIHVQSISNFELATMDYDMDMWLRMIWRDPRLAHGYSSPVLISEETFLKRFWRPDPFFVNSRDSLFHRVTYLNFYMYIFPGGEMFFEARLYLKPKCQLVLCNYPHDSQICSLRISSTAFTTNVVQFQWFSKIQDAIYFNQNVQLPDLYITDYEKAECDGTRKSAKFYMKRNLGYHLAQTYVPTATCVFFSWISVWMPEEFVKGRVFVSLTVFLTLSAESSAAKENLPKVSYVKAIDIWFGFVSTFVFFTMIQALVVIALEQRSKSMKQQAIDMENELSFGQLASLNYNSKRFHKMARNLDTFFKIMYPVIFIIFLMIYYFAIIARDEQECLREAQRSHVEL